MLHFFDTIASNKKNKVKIVRIIDVAEPFVKNYEATKNYLDDYYTKYEKDYEEYFKYHCLNVEEKKRKAIKLHPTKLQDILPMRDLFLEYIPVIAETYESMFQINFTKDVRLLVGLYGSNAFTYRQYDPEIAFCLEKLPFNKTHIQLIIAHEFGHATHHLYNDTNQISWDKVNWNNPYTWLLQEGLATYLSTKIVEAELDEYFAFEEDKKWIQFASENESRIAEKYTEEMAEGIENAQIYKEWFSISGGHHFKQTRLAYYLGYRVVVNLVDLMGIEKVLLLWGETQFKEIMKEQLQKLIKR